MLLGKDSFNHKTIIVNQDFIVRLIALGKYTEAYQLLITLTQTKKEVCNLFNLALCYYYGEIYQQTIYTLDEVLSLLMITPRNQALLPVDKDCKILLSKQNQSECYQSGITDEYFSYFPEIVKDSILRIKVDCYLHLQQWDRVLEVGNTIRNKGYKNVNNAILLAESKLHKN